MYICKMSIRNDKYQVTCSMFTGCRLQATGSVGDE